MGADAGWATTATDPVRRDHPRHAGQKRLELPMQAVDALRCIILAPSATAHCPGATPGRRLLLASGCGPVHGRDRAYTVRPRALA